MSQPLSVSDNLSQATLPLPFLEQIANSKSSGVINVTSFGIQWVFAFDQGNLVYATNSIDPWDRLQRHLRRLSHVVPSLTRDVCFNLRLNVETNSAPLFPAYLAIVWLVERQYLQPEEAQVLVERMTTEVVKSYLLLPQIVSLQFTPSPFVLPIYYGVALSNVVGDCRQRLEAWTAYLPLIWSPFQRPYFFTNRYSEEKLSLAQRQKLSQMLKGFSLRHLSALLNLDEIMIAKRFYPLIRQKAIILREPSPPFDLLPRFSTEIANLQSTLPLGEEEEITFSSFSDSAIQSKTWKVVCIDDSPTILKEIDRFLDSENLEVFTIRDSLKALMQILRIKPDLILMDVGMPNVDGYKLCSMLRKSPLLKTTPIIMVTGKTGLIDRARARMVGATDYMTKPFTQSELLQIVFRYLT